jgi:peptidyl-prolyl cis-trans isomerase D
MLQTIRERLTGGVAAVIMGLILIPFMFFGVQNLPFISNPYAAKVDGSEISMNGFEQAYRDQLQRNPQLAKLPDQYRLELRRQLLDSMVRDRLVELHLADKGYHISDKQLMDTIEQVPNFQVDGKFDMETYRSVLSQNALTPKEFEARQRRAMRVDQLQRAVAATAIVTPAQFRRYLNLVAEQRQVQIATFDLDAVAKTVEVGDDEIKAYYDDNGTLYMTPESADIEMIEVNRDEVAKSIDISDDELKAYYESEKSRFLRDEEREARHILIPFGDDKDAARAKAEELLARAKAGEPFADLARTYSKDGGTASNGGDLGALTRSQLPDALGDAIFSMKEGDIRGPVESDFGYHVVKLDKILERGPLPFDQVRSELLNELRESKSEDAYRELERKMSDALFEKPDMQSISDATGLPIQSATGITRSGGGPVGNNQAAIDAIFDSRVLNDGQVSDLVEMDNNRSAIFKVTAHHEAAREPLEAVRDRIVEAVRNEKATAIVSERSDTMLASLAAGKSFAAAGEAAGAVVEAPKLVGRQDKDLAPTLLTAVFEARKPAGDTPVRDKVAMPGGGYAVYSLDGVLPGRPESIPLADRDAGKRQLVQQEGQADYQAFVQAMYEKADVVISKDALTEQEFQQ